MDKFKIGLSIPVLLFMGCLFNERLSHARIAEKLWQEKKYDQAVSEYELHIQSRLAAAGRDPGENPYFYRLLIGDVYLESGDLDKAEANYLEALNQGVDKELVGSKIREIAEQLVVQGKPEPAMDLLRKHRELDPLMSDLEIDRIFKTTLSAPQ